MISSKKYFFLLKCILVFQELVIPDTTETLDSNTTTSKSGILTLHVYEYMYFGCSSACEEPNHNKTTESANPVCRDTMYWQLWHLVYSVAPFTNMV